MNPTRQDQVQAQQEQAWVGDAVLAVYIREWILREHRGLDGERFTRFTSNDSLAAIGNPTAVEAAIGIVYAGEGLQAAFDHIEEHIMPALERREKSFQKSEAQRARAKAGKSKRSRWKNSVPGIG